MGEMDNKITIRRYCADDESFLFAMIERAGEEWREYRSHPERYRKALAGSINYVLHHGNELCGYIRCRDDDGYGIYVYDLLVDASHRGKGYGRRLLEHILHEFTDVPVYVMSDVDGYYEKLGYRKEGTIFIATR